MRRVAGALSASVLATVLAGCSIDAPSIVAIVPGRDARDVATNQEIRITFDRAMDHQSVGQHFELRPALPGCASCGLVWRGDTVVYTHTQVNFQLNTHYEVLLHGGYRDAGGHENSLEHSWRFTTEGVPALAAVDPTDGATGVSPDRNLILTFTRPMEAASVGAGLTLSPDVPYLLRSRPGGDGSQLEVIPTVLLEAGTTYTMTLQGARDAHGNLLPGPLARTFTVGSENYARKIAYLVGDRQQVAFGVAIVDPHPDLFLGRATPKVAYTLASDDRATQTILGFDWSPDGTRIALVIAERGAPDGFLRIVDFHSGAVEDLPYHGAAVAWSPDGSGIAYVSQQTLHLYRPTANDDVVLTHDQVVLPPLAFAPDGKSIAYAIQDSSGRPRLQITNVQLRSSFRPIGLEDPADHPSWSLDGTKLAFRRLTQSGPQVWVYDLSASGSVYRQEASLDLSASTWLNDNSSLVVGVGTGSTGALYRVNVFAPTEAGGLTRMTGVAAAPNGMEPAAPAYDRRIAFTAIVDGLPQLMVMNGDGSGAAQLTRDESDYPYTAGAANWNPLG